MDFGAFIPITLFACIAYAIKVVADARVRKQMMDSNGSQDLVRSMLETEEASRRHGSLRWGITLLAIGLGFGVISVSGMDDLTPATLAILVGATGLGNLAYYVASRRLG